MIPLANPVSVAAGIACLTKIMTDEAYKHLNKLGERFNKGVKESVRRHGLKAVVPGKLVRDIGPPPFDRSFLVR